MFDCWPFIREVIAMNSILRSMVVAACIALLTAGCASTKPLESDVASLKTQVGTLQAEVDSLKRNQATAAQSATEAQRAAQSATAKADQALAAAQAAEKKAEATNE